MASIITYKDPIKYKVYILKYNKDKDIEAIEEDIEAKDKDVEAIDKYIQTKDKNIEKEKV